MIDQIMINLVRGFHQRASAVTDSDRVWTIIKKKKTAFAGSLPQTTSPWNNTTLRPTSVCSTGRWLYRCWPPRSTRRSWTNRVTSPATWTRSSETWLPTTCSLPRSTCRPGRGNPRSLLWTHKRFGKYLPGNIYMPL